MADVKYFYGTGKRKTSVARVYLKAGEGRITVNGKEFNDYFPVLSLTKVALSPLEETGNMTNFDIKVTLKGGGINAQADAVKYGIAKALLALEPEMRPLLKKQGFLTRDARVKERKKYGRPGARKRFQFSKR